MLEASRETFLTDTHEIHTHTQDELLLCNSDAKKDRPNKSNEHDRNLTEGEETEILSICIHSIIFISILTNAKLTATGTLGAIFCPKCQTNNNLHSSCISQQRLPKYSPQYHT